MSQGEIGRAPELFVAWLSSHTANDKKFGRKVFRYHPRSDEHSKKLCSLVLDDMLRASALIAEHIRTGKVVAAINYSYTFSNGKKKALDLAVGTPGKEEAIERLLIACEAKQCMTEHGKTQPRIFDELSSAHEIVHQGDTLIVSLGLVVVNVASRYASPTRQTSGEGPLNFTNHRQPDVTESMVKHLRGLKVRDNPGETGFDAFATVVIDCDNLGACQLHTMMPAPQPGDKDHYNTFLARLTAAYAARFAGL